MSQESQSADGSGRLELAYETSMGHGPHGDVRSRGVMLCDELATFYHLQIETIDHLLARITEVPDEGLSREEGEDIEPVFLIPNMAITPEIVESIIEGINPNILRWFLVEQD